MDMDLILDWIGNFIYGMMAAVALYGTYTLIMLARRVGSKRFGSHSQAEGFLDGVRESLEAQKYEEAADQCDTHPFWSKAVPQLILVGLANRNRPLSKLRLIWSCG